MSVPSESTTTSSPEELTSALVMDTPSAPAALCLLGFPEPGLRCLLSDPEHLGSRVPFLSFEALNSWAPEGPSGPIGPISGAIW